VGETPEQRSLHAKLAANTRWSKEDPAGTGVRAQAGLWAKFEREAREYEPGLTDAEYARRAESAYRAHMQRLAYRSAQVRRAKAASLIKLSGTT
jgi:hypothetical protein